MKEFIKNLRFAWNYTKDNKFVLVRYLICDFFSIIIRVLIPILSAKVIVYLTDNKFYQLINIAVVIFITENIFNIISRYSKYCMNVVYHDALSKVEVDLGKNILKLENKIIDEKGSGVFIQRLTIDTSRLADIFVVLNIYITNILTEVGMFFAIFIISKLVFCYLVIITILLYIIQKLKTKKFNNQDKKYRKKLEKVSGFTTELVRGSRDIKMLNAEDNFINELKDKIIDANEEHCNMQKTSRKYSFYIGGLLDTNDLLLIILLVYLISNNYLIVSSALVIYNYSSKISYLVDHIGILLEKVKDFNLSTNRINDIINSNEFKKENFGATHIKKVNGDFEFKNVSFSYGKKKIIDDLSFKINANETVAFVGKSGAGKSTIFSLLIKMYDIKNGEILIDGININELDKDTIRGNITIISQNPYIFNLSIKENLKLVKKNANNKEIKEACKIACLDEFIEGLPDKYDTIIGEGGVNLSGGQKQRLAIARALIQKTEIILFDEATSALDNETQYKIKKAIDNMKNEYTILIIAHRLSTIIDCDRILFIKDGKIKDSGTHDYLLKNCSEYKELYESELSKNE